MTSNTSDTIVPAATIGSPYFDDYDETKNFLRILFRPGKGVQSRELIQLQTILQKQIQRFGQGVFENGSMVTGGQITFQGLKEQIAYLNLSPTYANTAVVAANLDFQQIVSVNSSNLATPRAWVLTTSEQSTSEPPTLVIKYNTDTKFNANDTIQALNQANVLANVTATGNASVASINAGVYFFNGFFIRVEPQTIALDKYDNTPTCRVGLEFEDEIVDENADTSLFDPAQGASGYQSPGATRYKASLILATRTLTSTDDSKFIELMRIVNGVITKKVEYPIYTDIETTLARRTFDQSGSFTVKPFTSELHDHTPETIDGTGTLTANTNTVAGSNTTFLDQVSVNSILYINNQSALVNTVSSNIALSLANNLLYAANGQMQVFNPNKFTLKLSAGKAYVRGHEFSTISPTNVGIKRGRAYANVTNYDSQSPLGNYLFTSNAHGIPDFTIMESFDLHVVSTGSINFTSASSYANSKIGTAKVRAHEYSSSVGNTSNGLQHIYKTYLFDVALANATYTMNSVMALATFDAAANTSFNKRMDIDSSSKSNTNLNGNTFFTDANFNRLVYVFPQQTLVPGSITNASLQYRKLSSNVSFSNGVATLTLSSPEAFVGSGTLSDTAKLTNFIVTIKDRTGMPAAYANGDIIPLTTTLGRSVTVSPVTSATIDTAIGNTFTGDVSFSTRIVGTAPGPRVKTLVSSNTTNVAVTSNSFITATNTSVFLANGQIQVTQNNNIIKTTGVSQNVYICDIVSLDKVYDFLGNAITQANLASATDITTSYSLDNGQRDNYYDQGAIKLKPGFQPPTGPLLICTSYYSHSGTSGYLTVDSYPSVTTDAGYTAIPNYISPTDGMAFSLRDCLDWRPIKTNATDLSSSAAPFVSPRILEPGQPFTSNFSYYLSRIDKVVLTQDMVFKVIPGVPAQYPTTPTEDPNDMLLYTLQIPAYTFNPNNVNVIYNENRRYTMRDIGGLDKRISNLEYYTALNLLEKSSETLTVTDSTGLNRFKNGIIVDNFTGHKVGDINLFDYQCSMDFLKGRLRPMFAANNAVFAVNSGNSTNFKYQGDQVTLDYTVAEFLSQNTATAYTTVNLFNYMQWIGNLKLIPDTDTWYDVVNRPQVLVNLEGENDAWEALTNQYNSSGQGTRFGAWQTTWTGVPTISFSTQVTTDGTVDTGAISSTYLTKTAGQVRSITNQTITPQTITKSIGDSVVDVSVIPYIREREIVVFSNNLKPMATYYPFFDSKNMVHHWRNPLILQVGIPVTGIFYANSFTETLTSNSGGTALIVDQPRVASLVSNTAYPYITLVNVKGSFMANGTVSGSIGGATANIIAVYQFSDNCASACSNSYIVNLNTSANFSNSALVGHPLVLAEGYAGGQIRRIVTWDNIAKQATVDTPFTTAPAGNTIYSIGYPLSSPLGVVAGTLYIPNTPTERFFVGEKAVRLSTSPTNSTQDVASYADQSFFAEGLLQTKQETVVSTRVPTLTQTTTQQEQTLTNTVVLGSTYTQYVQRDPTPVQNTQPTVPSSPPVSPVIVTGAVPTQPAPVVPAHQYWLDFPFIADPETLSAWSAWVSAINATPP